MAGPQAPARALGRFEVRTPPRTLDEMFACATNEAEREAIRDAHVRQRDGRASTATCPTPCATPRCAGAPGVPRGELHVPRARTRRAARRAWPSPSPPRARRGHVQGARAASAPCPITSATCSSAAAASCATTPRSTRILVARRPASAAWSSKDGDDDHRPGRRLEPRPRRYTFTELIDRRRPARRLARRVDAIDHRAAYFQMHFALDASCPSSPGRTRCSTRAELRSTSACSARPRRCSATTRPACRGEVPEAPAAVARHPVALDPDLAPEGKPRRQRLRVLRADRGRPRGQGPAARRDGRADGRADRRRRAQLPRLPSSARSATPPTATS